MPQSNNSFTSSTSLLGYISLGTPYLINWDKVSESELQEALKESPYLLEGLVLDKIWGNMPINLQKFSLTTESHGEDKLIHYILRNDQTKIIPKVLLNKELLSIKGNGGQSGFHLLTKNQETHFIDNNLLTKEVLLLKDHSDSTPLHAIVMYASDIVSKRDIDIDELVIENDIRQTPLYNWSSSTEWSKIPDKFLTKETLGQTKDGPVPILNIIIQQHKYDIATGVKPNANHSLEKIFGKIDNNELNRFVGDTEPAINKLAKKELAKRIVLKEIQKESQCLEI